MLSHLLIQAGSPQPKIDYIRFKILPIILYSAQVANWTLAQYRNLDAPFTDAYRKLLSLPKKSPQAIIYLPNKYCGIGMKKLSDLAQKFKWNNLLRCQALGRGPQRCMNELLNRIPQADHPKYSPIRVIHPRHVTATNTTNDFKRGAHYTARSLLEWTKEAGIVIANRVRENYQIQQDHTDNAMTIKRYAQAAQLWPHEKKFGEDQVLRDVKFYVTDGSFTVKTSGAKDIITSEQTLRDAGQGAGGIVLMPRFPTENVMGLHIKSDKPQPGMNAYTWELLTAVVGLHLAKYMPSLVMGHSDCMSAITRLNDAMLAFHNTQSHVKAGVLISGGYEFRAAEENTRDRTMKRSEIGEPRLISWIRSHPEKDERAQNPDQKATGMFMADAVAALEHKTKRKLGDTRLPEVEVETLEFKNILNEIIPMFEWHFRLANDHNSPVFDDPIDHQHRAQLKKMTTNRDKANNVQRWSTTALEFTASVHKPNDNSYWAAARRALIVFDWMGHGRNRAKMCSNNPVQKQLEEKCRICGMIDSQQHLLLECTHAPLTDIRAEAHKKQKSIACALKKDHAKSQNLQHFITQFTNRSWNTNTVELTRLWLGTWSTSTLLDMLKQLPDTPMSMDTRAKYIKIVRKLTKPLIDAYYLMLKEVIATSPTNGAHADDLPLLDHLMPSLMRQEIEATHIQNTTICNGCPPRPGPSLNNTNTLSPFHEFIIADAALLQEQAASTF